MAGLNVDPCVEAEKRLQPYLDRMLTSDEVAAVEAHLSACRYCADRYVFEAKLRATVKRCCSDPIPAGMVERLHRLRAGA